MATEFILKVRNPELKDQLEEIVGVINTLEDGVAGLESEVAYLEAGVEAVAVSGAPVAPVAATGILTIATQPTAADTITIAQGAVTEVYTFVEAAEGDFDVALGLDVGATQVALAAVINDHSALVTAGAFAANASTITAKVKGVIGNTIATTSELTAETDGFAAATLGTGVDGTAGLDGQIRYAADKIYVSVGVSTTAVSNWKSAALS
jgi:hypothetical protein